jgi:Hydrazine synthase alpha subunit middle domain
MRTILRTRIQVGIVLSVALGAAACGSDDSTSPLDRVDAIVFLQRTPRNEMGDIFQYRSYRPGGRLVKLSPPTADGKLVELCCSNAGAEFAAIDIQNYDLSFDAQATPAKGEIVFSGKLSDNQNFGLFILHLETGAVEQLATDPQHDYTNPIFLPGDKILFTTNRSVEEGAPQHRDEYERGETLQLGVMNRDGSNQVLGPRNLSHRVFPTLASDGRVLVTQWDHLGDMNAGHLMFVNPDMTTLREAFGKESTGVTNSYLKAQEISPGRFVAIGTARDRTVQSGAILDVRLGKPGSDGKGGILANVEMSEANAEARILTPSVPLGREPSASTIGRYYDAFPLDAADYPTLLVSWSDGTVESGTLEAAGKSAQFGLYVYDSKAKARRPLYDDPTRWDVLARPLAPRVAPPVIPASATHSYNQHTTLIGSMNVYQSSVATLPANSVYGVRVIEGFSTEEGIPRDFGLTEHEGAAVLGVAPVETDGSWAALVPANVPVHLQPIDNFGLAVVNEPVWFSGKEGESRFCGGCHENRTAATTIQPGITQAIGRGPVTLLATTPRADRVTTTFNRSGTVGVPWDQALQPVFDRACVSCHNGTPGAANPSWTISDPATGATFTWTFDLRGGPATYGIGDAMLSGYSASHLSLIGPSMRDLERANLVVVGDLTVYVEPGDARGSKLIEKLNPPRQFPNVDMNQRAFATAAHAQAVGHELTADEYYLLVLMADNGGQFYSRENAPL